MGETLLKIALENSEKEIRREVSERIVEEGRLERQISLLCMTQRIRNALIARAKALGLNKPAEQKLRSDYHDQRNGDLGLRKAELRKAALGKALVHKSPDMAVTLFLRESTILSNTRRRERTTSRGRGCPRRLKRICSDPGTNVQGDDAQAGAEEGAEGHDQSSESGRDSNVSGHGLDINGELDTDGDLDPEFEQYYEENFAFG